ncbi:hypothetical protein QYZ88_011075 [Lachnospiraceae bacterium C1.1]|nr:hypothetical protein [Lachnospiraceae bacterium C1.1]
MNIVVWGTGGNAVRFFNEILPVINAGIDVNVVGVIDDNDSRAGSCFMGYKISILSEIGKFKELDYVLQVETFGGFSFEESKKKLICYGDKLIDIFGLSRILNKSGYWTEQRILFMGDRAEYIGSGYMSKFVFKTEKYIEPKEINEVDLNDYDYIFLCAGWYSDPEKNYKKEMKIRKKLSSSFDKSRILCGEIWTQIITAGELKVITKGNKNPDKKFYLITRDRYVGWGILLYHFGSQITFAKKNGYIPIIDMKNYPNQYNSDEELYKINAWEKFFEPLYKEYSVDEVYESANVFLGGKQMHIESERDISRFKWNAKTQEILNREYDKLFPHKGEKVLGVVYRGTDFGSAFLHAKVVSVNEFIENAEKYMKENGYSHIFLATEVQEVTELFKKRFGDKVSFTSQQRYSAKERRFLADIHFSRDNDAYLKGIEYLTVIHLLSKCDGIYGIICGSVVCAQMLRENSIKVQLYETEKNVSFSYKLLVVRDKFKRKVKRTMKLGEYSMNYRG